jgi:RNA polymerase primary sigma factor
MNFISEIKKFKILSKEEELELLISAKKGDLKSKNDLVKSNLKYVVYIAKKYQGMGIDLEDLISFGSIGLFKSIDKFDLDNDVKFITFAIYNIKAEIKKALNDLSRLVRIPSHKTKVDNKYVKSHNLSLSDDENKKVFDNIKSDSQIKDESLNIDINRALNYLPIKQRNVIKMYYGIGYIKPMSMEEVGLELNITNERVRQLIRSGEKTLSEVSGKILKKYI